MPLWGPNDNSANTPIGVTENQLSLTHDPANTQTTLFANSNATFGLFAVSNGEMQAARSGNTSRPAHAGWNLRKEGTGGRAGRVTYETLVAGDFVLGDAENVAFPNYNIVITQQPAASANGVGLGNSVNFTVVAKSMPTGATLVYHWQVDGGPGVKNFANVANSGIYASANGNTTATLSISNNVTLNGNTYRVRIALAGANTRFSSNAFLSVV